ncbi:MAG: glycosyltransferase family 2 protein [Selenomonadaceae bacterium]|nr:glycosyltransferase family 2 protein [Selenomonadaceae bacterium]
MSKTNNKLPLVSVIIPTYCRPKYFEIALKSVLNQTYQNIEIFITDNSPDDKTKILMRKYLDKYTNIIYEHHPEYSEMDNWECAMAYNNPKAEYVNWLMDDDIFLPNKIAYMVDKFIQYENLALVTSYRQCIDEKGKILPDYNTTIPIADTDTIYTGLIAGRDILINMRNYIGEPTTVMIKKSCMKNGTLGARVSNDKYWVSDFPTWLQCLEHGDLYYSSTPLSQFRIHSGQVQLDNCFYGKVLCKWAIEYLYEYQRPQFIKHRCELDLAIDRWFDELDYYIDNTIKNKYLDCEIINALIEFSEKLITCKRNQL